ncbi:MAG: cupin domain-containing protein [Myxococcales bacterium]|nr:cupin domain-containing protein [Myxococcales bacterium]
MKLPAGITAAGTGQDGVVWSVLGHTYWLKAECESCFAFGTLDPPGTFVPPHIHPTQDEFIYLLEGALDLQLDEARQRSVIRRPCLGERQTGRVVLRRGEDGGQVALVGHEITVVVGGARGNRAPARAT